MDIHIPTLVPLDSVPLNSCIRVGGRWGVVVAWARPVRVPVDVLFADGQIETLSPDTMVQPGISATEAAYRYCQELQKREAEQGDSWQSLKAWPPKENAAADICPPAGGGGVG